MEIIGSLVGVRLEEVSVLHRRLDIVNRARSNDLHPKKSPGQLPFLLPYWKKTRTTMSRSSSPRTISSAPLRPSRTVAAAFIVSGSAGKRHQLSLPSARWEQQLTVFHKDLGRDERANALDALVIEVVESCKDRSRAK